ERLAKIGDDQRPLPIRECTRQVDDVRRRERHPELGAPWEGWLASRERCCRFRDAFGRDTDLTADRLQLGQRESLRRRCVPARKRWRRGRLEDFGDLVLLVAPLICHALPPTCR